MMIFIKYLKTEEQKAIVDYIHFTPFDEKKGLGKSPEELELEGILVESIPEPKQQEGKIAVLYANPETKELWYEYEDMPITPEEELVRIKEQLKTTQEAVDFLIMNGGL